jgi:zinc protease
MTIPNRVSTRVLAGVVALTTSAVVAATAQVTTPPVLGPVPRLTLPAIERTTLPNGITILVSRNAEVPIVNAQLMVDGGTRVTGFPAGLASFANSALMEGAAGRSGVDLAQAINLLGASISAGATAEAFVVAMRSPKRSVDDAMALMADVALRPNFSGPDIRRLRDLRLNALLQERDQPAAVADWVFTRNVFPAGHPYHLRPGGDSADVTAFDSSAVRQLWTRAIDPRKATIVLTGDVTLADARTWVTRHFGNWAAPAAPLVKPSIAAVAPPPHPTTRIILVDKPDAAQSVIYIGAPGVPRNSPDYPAITLMNTILGGSFSSRLNDFLREQLGYAYGARSEFGWAPVPAAFVATAAVRTNVTDSSLAVFFREFRRIRDTQITPVELQRGKSYVVLGALDNYETAGEVAGAIEESVEFGTALSQIPEEFARVNALSTADVQRAAQRYLDPARLTIVIVGDVAKIRSGIEKLNLGPIEVQKD